MNEDKLSKILKKSKEDVTSAWKTKDEVYSKISLKTTLLPGSLLELVGLKNAVVMAAVALVIILTFVFTNNPEAPKLAKSLDLYDEYSLALSFDESGESEEYYEDENGYESTEEDLVASEDSEYGDELQGVFDAYDNII